MDAYERVVTRRELLRLGVAASVAVAWVPSGLLWGSNEGLLPVTPPVTLGPFYPVIRPVDQDSDLTRVTGHTGHAQGQVLHIAGRVINRRGEPVARQVLEARPVRPHPL